jgi:hypothetical protein
MISKTLPQGDGIRQLLVKSSISDANVASVLKEKGVFVGGLDKNHSVPPLMKSIIGPNDFRVLFDLQRNKEQTIKHRTVTIEVNQGVLDIRDVFKRKISINDIVKKSFTYKPNYHIIGDPQFFFEDDSAIIQYKLNRTNLLNDWTENESVHDASIHVKLSDSGKVIMTIQQNHTAKETLEVNRMIVAQLKSDLQEQSLLAEKEEFSSIKFNDFDNKNRLKFLMSCARKLGVYADFEALVDVNLYLDESVESKSDVKNFLAEIENLKLKGKGLHNHIFFKDETYQDKLQTASIKLKFKVNDYRLDGFLSLTLSFSDFIGKKLLSSELETELSFSSKNKKRVPAIETELRRDILPIIEQLKIESYTKFRTFYN